MQRDFLIDGNVMKVVVGLGNPGSRYEGTRHNVGFEIVDYLAAAPGVGPFRSRFQALVAEGQEGDEPYLLVKPETFMNLSGRSVRQLVDFYKLPIEHLLIICDDINLPLGKLRIRSKGSHGGQNGLRNIQEQLGTQEYARLRVGIGSPGEIDAADFVLSRFRPGERPVIDEAIRTAGDAALCWMRQGIEACMNRYNAAADASEKPKKTPRTEPPTPTSEMT